MGFRRDIFPYACFLNTLGGLFLHGQNVKVLAAKKVRSAFFACLARNALDASIDLRLLYAGPFVGLVL
jgi:hypothetical protein